jgi:hypothetical protein
MMWMGLIQSVDGLERKQTKPPRRTLPPHCLLTQDYYMSACGILSLLIYHVNFKLASSYSYINQSPKINPSLPGRVCVCPILLLLRTLTDTV